MWADVLQHAEKLHLLRLCLWGALSTLAGTALLVLGVAHRGLSDLLSRFGLLCAVLGGAELLVAALGYRDVGLRDVGGATRLDRLAWLQLGLFVGFAGIGVTLTLIGRGARSGAGAAQRRGLSSVGAGIAILLHGVALATLELLLIAAISR